MLAWMLELLHIWMFDQIITCVLIWSSNTDWSCNDKRRGLDSTNNSSVIPHSKNIIPNTPNNDIIFNIIWQSINNNNTPMPTWAIQ